MLEINVWKARMCAFGVHRCTRFKDNKANGGGAIYLRRTAKADFYGSVLATAHPLAFRMFEYLLDYSH
jgi:hypothetical protein